MENNKIFEEYKSYLESVKSDYSCDKCKYSQLKCKEKHWCVNMDCKNYCIIRNNSVEKFKSEV